MLEASLELLVIEVDEEHLEAEPDEALNDEDHSLSELILLSPWIFGSLLCISTMSFCYNVSRTL